MLNLDRVVIYLCLLSLIFAEKVEVDSDPNSDHGKVADFIQSVQRHLWLFVCVDWSIGDRSRCLRSLLGGEI